MSSTFIITILVPVLPILTLVINNWYQRKSTKANADKNNSEAQKARTEASVLNSKEYRDQEEFKDRQIDRLQEMVEDLINKNETCECEKEESIKELEKVLEKFRESEKRSNQFRIELNFLRLELQAWKQKAEK